MCLLKLFEKIVVDLSSIKLGSFPVLALLIPMVVLSIIKRASLPLQKAY